LPHEALNYQDSFSIVGILELCQLGALRTFMAA